MLKHEWVGYTITNIINQSTNSNRGNNIIINIRNTCYIVNIISKSYQPLLLITVLGVDVDDEVDLLHDLRNAQHLHLNDLIS